MRSFFVNKSFNRSGEDVTVMEEDLRICLVRPLMDIDRRFCFEVISPSKSHVLQADSDKEAEKWISTLKQGISNALHETMTAEKSENPVNVNEGDALKWDDSDNEEDNEHGAKSSPLERKKKVKRGKRSAKQILLIPGKKLITHLFFSHSNTYFKRDKNILI